MGLGPEALMKLHPGLIYCEMSAFGAVGPYNFFRAYGMTAEKASSLPFANGQEDWPPCMQNLATGDPTTGIFGAAVALMALHARDEVGGSYIDMAQAQCVFQFGADLLLTRQITGKPLPRTGSRRPTVAPCCVVPAKDDDTWLAVAVDNDAAWKSLAEILGKPEWADDPALATLADRNARADAIEAVIADWAKPREVRAATDLLQAAGIAAAPVLPGHELLNDPQLVASGYWQYMDRQYVGKHLHGVAPFTLDGKRPALRTPAPLLGEHTEEILKELAS